MYYINQCTPESAEALEPAILQLGLTAHLVPDNADHLTAAPTPAAITATVIASQGIFATCGARMPAADAFPQGRGGSVPEGGVALIAHKRNSSVSQGTVQDLFDAGAEGPTLEGRPGLGLPDKEPRADNVALSPVTCLMLGMNAGT